MQGCKVSVIIPVYNAEAYLRDTLGSVTAQTLKEIEIICVDDGSSDKSREIIGEYALKDDRITLLTQENLFAGVARNNGLKKATGDYIVFWDSDDFFEKNALEEMYNRIRSDKADICLCDAWYYSDGKDIVANDFVKYRLLPAEIPFSRRDIPDKIFNMGANVPWNKMFRREFILEKGIEFQNIRQANDTYFVLMALFLADRITYTKKRLVHYRINTQGGLTNSVHKEPLCTYEAYSYLSAELEKLPFYSDENRKSFANRTVRGLLRSLHIQTTQQGYDAVWEKLRNGGLDKMGLIMSEDDYEEKWLYEDVQSILTRTPLEHMIYKYNCAKTSKAVKVAKLEETKKQLNEVRSKWYVRIFFNLERMIKKITGR